MGKEAKTNAMRILERAKVPYTAHEYAHEEGVAVDGVTVAASMEKIVMIEAGAKEVHMRSACPPIMYGCKYLNFSRSTSELELIARKIIDEFEGAEGVKYISEYSDTNTERGQKLRNEICSLIHKKQVMCLLL